MFDVMIGLGQEIDVETAGRAVANRMLHDGYRQECVTIFGGLGHQTVVKAHLHCPLDLRENTRLLLRARTAFLPRRIFRFVSEPAAHWSEAGCSPPPGAA